MSPYTLIFARRVIFTGKLQFSQTAPFGALPDFSALLRSYCYNGVFTRIKCMYYLLFMDSASHLADISPNGNCSGLVEGTKGQNPQLEGQIREVWSIYTLMYRHTK